MWSELGSFAPHTKATFESIGRAKIHPVLERIPRWLMDVNFDQSSSNWGEFLNEKTSYGISNRERLLRYLITRSVVDQGSDIAGVEEWHEGTFSRCYEMGIPLLDDLSLVVTRYSEILQIADEFRLQTIEHRSHTWANLSENRKEAAYWPFTVDGQRGKGNTHWFLTARVFPTLFLAQAVDGGLTEFVFGNSEFESPREMARRLRNDPGHKLGLSWVMGDKACDLFAKWSIGSYRLTSGMVCSWTPQDCPIPMDQRIGRLMIRTGLMDEFYGVAAEMNIASHGWSPRGNQMRPSGRDEEITDGDWHLTVMDFRRQARVKGNRPEALSWIRESMQLLGRKFEASKTSPQDIVSLLCRVYSEEFGHVLTPVEVDDYFMEVGGGPCQDRSMACSQCGLENSCQANNDVKRSRLKNCFT